MPNYIKLEIPGSHSLIIIDPKKCHGKQNRVDQMNQLLALSKENIGRNETIGSTVDEIIDFTDLNPNCCGLENSPKNNICKVVQMSMKASKEPDCNKTHIYIANSIHSTDIGIPIIQTKPQFDHCYHLKSHEDENSYEQQNIGERMAIKQTDVLHHNSTKKMPNSITNASSLQLNQVENIYTKHNMAKRTSIQKNLLHHNSKVPNATKSPSTFQLIQKNCISEKMASIPIDKAAILQKHQTQQCSKKRKIESVKSTEVLQAQHFSLNAIRDYFVKNPLPKSWSWIENKKFDTIIFVHISRATQQIRCYVECKEDLSINVYTSDKHTISKLANVVTSIDDILSLLLKVYSLRICEANAVNEMRSVNCSLILNEHETYKRKLLVDRCSNCRNEEKSKSKWFQKPRINVDVNKNRELSQKLYQMTKSCEYYREKCDRMKEMLQNLKKLCVTTQSTAKKTALDEAISQLPSLQQEVVRACFDNANVDPKHQKYGANYAYKCFSLQAVNDAAYEHIKQRNLLPLPCKSTLKRK